MGSEIVEAPTGARLAGLMEGAERANAVLHALLQDGYRNEGQRQSVGNGILLHHAGDGPDLVLYPDGSLHPVGIYRQPLVVPAALDWLAPRERSFKARFAFFVKGLAILVVAMGFCFLSLGLWLAILENF